MPTPMISASAKPWIFSPPKKYRAKSTNRVDAEVAKVRARVCVVETLMISSRSAFRITRRFSRTRSNTTMVSLSE